MEKIRERKIRKRKKMTSESKGNLTCRQNELLEYITECVHSEHRMPSYREMAKALKVSAVGTVQDHVQVLVEKGYLVKEGRQLRLAETRSGPMLSVPIVGEVAAGQLHDAYEVALGTLALSPNLLDSKSDAKDLFALRVKGDSMVDAGIYEGDYVVVRQNIKVKTGDIVVASYAHEATVKEISFSKTHSGEVVLIPHNKRLPPIHVKADEEFRVLGKVVSVQRYF